LAVEPGLVDAPLADVFFRRSRDDSLLFVELTVFFRQFLLQFFGCLQVSLAPDKRCDFAAIPLPGLERNHVNPFILQIMVRTDERVQKQFTV
jgi:hypothetical protein